MSRSRSPCVPSPAGLHSSPRSLFSSTTSSRKAAPFLPPRPACMRLFRMLTSEPLLSFEQWGSSRRSMIPSSPVGARCGGRHGMPDVSLDRWELMPRARLLRAASSTSTGLRGGFYLSDSAASAFRLYLLAINRRRDPDRGGGFLHVFHRLGRRKSVRSHTSCCAPAHLPTRRSRRRSDAAREAQVR